MLTHVVPRGAKGCQGVPRGAKGFTRSTKICPEVPRSGRRLTSGCKGGARKLPGKCQKGAKNGQKPSRKLQKVAKLYV